LQILQCSRFSTIEQCKEKYFSLSKVYHPDSPTGDNDKFVSIAQAFEEIQIYMK
jgi:curved DNA-binding protein CbpA